MSEITQTPKAGCCPKCGRAISAWQNFWYSHGAAFKCLGCGAAIMKTRSATAVAMLGTLAFLFAGWQMGYDKPPTWILGAIVLALGLYFTFQRYPVVEAPPKPK
jgi:hypothetical protein